MSTADPNPAPLASIVAPDPAPAAAKPTTIIDDGDPGEARAIASGWKIHDALTDWTGKVDSKASFMSAIEVAVIAGVLSLTGKSRILGQLRGFALVAFWIGLVALLIGLVLVVVVVLPRLRTRSMANETKNNFIYFGHLKDWTPERLQGSLRTEPLLPILTRQLVAMASIAWIKHKQLQWSIYFTGFGLVWITIAAANKCPG